MPERGRGTAALLLAIAFVATGCTRVSETGTAAAGNAWTRHRHLTIATNADPKNLNPMLASAQPTLPLSAFLYSYTVQYDEKAQPRPDALERIPTIENGDVAKDGLTLRYHLRRGMKWHDGVEVTCKDLRFTWQAVMNPHNNVITTDGYKDIRDIDCTDPYVAVIHMKRVYAPYLQQLFAPNGNAPIEPEHILAKYNDDKGSFNTAPYQAAPIGSGPYKFVSWQRGQSVRFEINPDYYLGKPGLDEIVYKIIPDENTLVTQLKTHEIDLAFALTGVTWEQSHNIPGTTAVTPIVYTYTHLDFNMRRPIFADVRVRRALAHAIDKQALLEKVQHGLGEPSDTFFSPTLAGPKYNANVRKYPYDPAQAKALLDQAGWKVGSDGIRVKNGTRLSFQISTQTESTNGKQVEALVQRYWHDVGVEAEVKNYPTDVFFDNTANGTLQGGKYDVASFSWVGAADVDTSAIYSAHYFAPKGQNALYWDNPKATALMDDANATVDQPRRVADYMEVQRLFAEDIPSIILWFRKEPEVYNSDLKNFSPTPVITTPFWNTWEYTI